MRAANRPRENSTVLPGKPATTVATCGAAPSDFQRSGERASYSYYRVLRWRNESLGRAEIPPSTSLPAIKRPGRASGTRLLFLRYLRVVHKAVDTRERHRRLLLSRSLSLLSYILRLYFIRPASPILSSFFPCALVLSPVPSALLSLFLSVSLSPSLPGTAKLKRNATRVSTFYSLGTIDRYRHGEYIIARRRDLGALMADSYYSAVAVTPPTFCDLPVKVVGKPYRERHPSRPTRTFPTPGRREGEWYRKRRCKSQRSSARKRTRCWRESSSGVCEDQPRYNPWNSESNYYFAKCVPHVSRGKPVGTILSNLSLCAETLPLVHGIDEVLSSLSLCLFPFLSFFCLLADSTGGKNTIGARKFSRR